ncbi:hypothetical protein [Amycolatopsis sp. NPDC059657]|uniref:hypothetical protein n=1 Tax=Amycolatopsis sp. NPDC059657 TaxID=3346899 RepID=UPI00366C83BA
MDLEQVENGLRVLEVPEPPLGFDVDVLVTKAAARQRRRRGLLISAGTALAAIGTAVTLVVMNLAPPPQVIDKAEPPFVIVSPHANLAKQMERSRQHLAKVIPVVKPDASSVAVNSFAQYREPGDWDSIWTMSTLFDPVSVSAFYLTINGPSFNAANLITPDQACTGFGTLPPEFTERWKTPDGKPQPCQRLTQPDGTLVLLVERQRAPRTATGDHGVMHAFNAIHFRADGSTVSLVNAAIGTDVTRQDPPPFTADQVIKLVTDPAFTLK